VNEQSADIRAKLRVVLAKNAVSLLTREAEMLESAGFTVFEVTSSDEAISYFESHVDIKWLVADLDIKGCFNGSDLAGFVEKRWPGVRVIILGVPARPLSNLHQTDFVPRPYTTADLIRRIRAKSTFSVVRDHQQRTTK
jgi:CheY-like chemotaxis protein